MVILITCQKPREKTGLLKSAGMGEKGNSQRSDSGIKTQ